MGVLVLAGPKSRDILSKITRTDLSNEKFPWLSSKKINVGLAPSIAMRMNFVGELGWELHHPIEYQNHIFDKLMEAGKDYGLKPFGIRAMESLRVEKTYKLVGTEMSIEYAAFESGLDRFVHLNKGNFIGRDALVKWQQKGFKNKMVTLEVHDVEDADALGNNPIYSKGQVIGRATGGNYGFRVKKSLAIGMVEPQYAKVGQNLEMDILDKKHKVTVIEDSPYDPNNEKLERNMKILVTVKRVIDYNVQIRVKPDGSGVEKDNVKMSMNPPDENAVEEALRIKESGKADEIIILSIGNDKAQETIRTALAMGADRGIHIKSDIDLEPLAISKIISKIAEEEKPIYYFNG